MNYELESIEVDTSIAETMIGYSDGYFRQLRAIGGGPPYRKLSNGQVRYRVSDLRAWAHLQGRPLLHQPVIDLTEVS